MLILLDDIFAFIDFCLGSVLQMIVDFSLEKFYASTHRRHDLHHRRSRCSDGSTEKKTRQRRGTDNFANLLNYIFATGF